VLATECGFVRDGSIHEPAAELDRPGLSLQVFKRV
jgi:hypothetical protein